MVGEYKFRLTKTTFVNIVVFWLDRKDELFSY